MTNIDICSGCLRLCPEGENCDAFSHWFHFSLLFSKRQPILAKVGDQEREETQYINTHLVNIKKYDIWGGRKCRSREGCKQWDRPCIKYDLNLGSQTPSSFFDCSENITQDKWIQIQFLIFVCEQITYWFRLIAWGQQIPEDPIELANSSFGLHILKIEKNWKDVQMWGKACFVL